MNKPRLSFVSFMQVVACAACLPALATTTTQQPRPTSPLKITVTLEKKSYRWDEGVRGRVTFTNQSDEPLTIPIRYSMAGGRFREVSFFWTHGKKRALFQHLHRGGDPQKVVIKPGKSASCHFRGLWHWFSSAEVRKLDGKEIEGRLPNVILNDSGVYTLSIAYAPRAGIFGKNIFSGSAKSNTVSFRRITKTDLNNAAREAYRKNRKTFSLLLRYHKAGKEAATKSVWLFACPVPYIYHGARVVEQVPEKTADQIFEFLVKSEYFANARLVDAKKLKKDPGEYYSWQVHGLDKKRVYDLHCSLISKLMTDFEKLRDILKDHGSELDAVVKSWEPVRVRWRKKTAYLQDAYKGMALCIRTPRPGDAKKTDEFWFANTKYSGKLPKPNANREVHRISDYYMKWIIEDLRHTDFFGKCLEKKSGANIGLTVVTKKYRLTQKLPWDWQIKSTMDQIAYHLGNDRKDKVVVAYYRLLKRHKLPVPPVNPGPAFREARLFRPQIPVRPCRKCFQFQIRVFLRSRNNGITQSIESWNLLMKVHETK